MGLRLRDMRRAAASGGAGCGAIAAGWVSVWGGGLFLQQHMHSEVHVCTRQAIPAVLCIVYVLLGEQHLLLLALIDVRAKQLQI